MNSANRRQEIVNAAFDCIAQSGHLSLSTTELALRVGISQPAIFRHFRSKQQLHAAILEEANLRIIELLKARIGQAERWNDPLGLLREILLDMGDTFIKKPGVWLTLISQRSLMGELGSDNDELVRLDNICASTQLRYAMERLCLAAMESGQLNEQCDPKALSCILISLLFGLGQHWLNSAEDFELKHQLNYALDGLLGGNRPNSVAHDTAITAIA